MSSKTTHPITPSFSKALSARCKALSTLPLLLASTALAKADEHGAAAAAEHAEAAEHGAHVSNWFNPLGEANQHAPALFWVFVTFFIFAGLLVKFAKKPLADYVRTRHLGVKDAIEEARKAKAEAEAKKREYDLRLSALDDEIAKLKQEFEVRGKAEVARLEEAGKRTAERIKKDAEDTILAESERAQEALKKEAARLALELAEVRILKAVNSDDEKRLQDAFLQEISMQ